MLENVVGAGGQHLEGSRALRTLEQRRRRCVCALVVGCQLFGGAEFSRMAVGLAARPPVVCPFEGSWTASKRTVLVQVSGADSVH